MHKLRLRKFKNISADFEARNRKRKEMAKTSPKNIGFRDAEEGQEQGQDRSKF